MGCRNEHDGARKSTFATVAAIEKLPHLHSCRGDQSWRADRSKPVIRVLLEDIAMVDFLQTERLLQIHTALDNEDKDEQTYKKAHPLLYCWLE